MDNKWLVNVTRRIVRDYLQKKEMTLGDLRNRFPEIIIHEMYNGPLKSNVRNYYRERNPKYKKINIDFVEEMNENRDRIIKYFG